MTHTTPKPCLFCELSQERIVMSNDLAMTIRDAFPVSPGHTLIVRKRHVVTFSIR
jgi:diadenosine tetraphosphate (Ap4A) HIT family hydrolase